MNTKFRSAFVTLAVATVISSGIITPAAAAHVAAPAPSGSVVHVLKSVATGDDPSSLGPNSRKLCDPKCQQ